MVHTSQRERPEMTPVTTSTRGDIPSGDGLSDEDQISDGGQVPETEEQESALEETLALQEISNLPTTESAKSSISWESTIQRRDAVKALYKTIGKFSNYLKHQRLFDRIKWFEDEAFKCSSSRDQYVGIVRSAIRMVSQHMIRPLVRAEIQEKATPDDPTDPSSRQMALYHSCARASAYVLSHAALRLIPGLAARVQIQQERVNGGLGSSNPLPAKRNSTSQPPAGTLESAGVNPQCISDIELKATVSGKPGTRQLPSSSGQIKAATEKRSTINPSATTLPCQRKTSDREQQQQNPQNSNSVSSAASHQLYDEPYAELSRGGFHPGHILTSPGIQARPIGAPPQVGAVYPHFPGASQTVPAPIQGPSSYEQVKPAQLQASMQQYYAQFMQQTPAVSTLPLISGASSLAHSAGQVGQVQSENVARAIAAIYQNAGGNAAQMSAALGRMIPGHARYRAHGSRSGEGINTKNGKCNSQGRASSSTVPSCASAETLQRQFSRGRLQEIANTHLDWLWQPPTAMGNEANIQLPSRDSARVQQPSLRVQAGQLHTPRTAGIPQKRSYEELLSVPSEVFDKVMELDENTEDVGGESPNTKRHRKSILDQCKMPSPYVQGISSTDWLDNILEDTDDIAGIAAPSHHGTENQKETVEDAKTLKGLDNPNDARGDISITAGKSSSISNSDMEGTSNNRD